MFGRRGNRASHYVHHYMPNDQHQINQLLWRQQQIPYYPSQIGSMGSFNQPFQQPYFHENQMIHQNPYPIMNPPSMPYGQYQGNGYSAINPGPSMPQNHYSQNIFQNPLDPEQQQQPVSNSPNPYFSNGYVNPYPKQSFIPKQPSGVQSFMNSFKAQDGSIDINKMMNTAGQMVNAVNQVSSLVKGLGGIIKV